MITAGNFATLLEPGLRRIFDIAVSDTPPMMETLFGLEASTKRNEDYQGIGAMGLVPPFTGTVPYEDFAGGYKTTIQNIELAQGITVERSLIDDDQYGQINRRALGLGRSFRNTIEHDAAQVFINGFTDAGTNRMGQSTDGGDSVGLLSAAHPHSPSDSGTTQSNEGTLDLNLPNVDTTRQAMMNFTDDKGNLLGVMPDTVLVPAELERTARQIFDPRAQWEPGSAQFDTNMFSGAFRVLVWNRLTDANAWFLLDSGLMKQHLIFQWRIRPEFAQSEDFDGIQVKYRGYMRYGIGWDDWRFVYGNNPS
tara:strand:+ start:309 stop:1232 length:924 start_codon:yes stop_codon:yes gene_type:complete